MPVMDGHEAIRRIRALASGADPKIIAVTASAMDENRQVLMEIGADDFIGKPFKKRSCSRRFTPTWGSSTFTRSSRPRREAAELTPEALAALPHDLLHPMRERLCGFFRVFSRLGPRFGSASTKTGLP